MIYPMHNAFMRFKLILLITPVIILSVAILLNNRIMVVDYFMVNNDHNAPSDLLVLLEGGDWVYSPTRERMNKVMELYNVRQTKILICSKQNLKSNIRSFLVSNGVKPKDIINSQYVYSNNGGTYNNVLEILDVMNANKEYQFIDIVTSPYHEKRVHIMISHLLPKSGIDRKINVNFVHINNSDVFSTDNKRYIGLLGHEVLGILVFYIQILGMNLNEYSTELVTYLDVIENA